jgi:hypothetical protein
MHATTPVTATHRGPLFAWASRFLGRVAGFLRCTIGSIAPMTALLMVPIAGSIAYSVEQGTWYYFQRSMQNAADSAAIAAASNNKSESIGGTPAYKVEAWAAARKAGFVDGTDNTTVDAAPIACPAGTASGSTCYAATIETILPLTFSSVVGFIGSDALGSGRGQRVLARAIATTAGGGGTTDICVLALSSVGTTFNSNGGPKPDMAGCSIMSNGSMTCNGHNLGATYGIAAGTNSGCGVTPVSNAATITDPYASKASNIPTNTCSAYSQLVKSGGNYSVAAGNRIAAGWTGSKTVCGDAQLTADVTLSGANTTLVVQNGRLDLNGHTIKTASGASATILFSGTNSSSYSHYPVSMAGGGAIDIAAPTTGSWSGVAIYQDPALTTNVSFTYSGNDPTWDISGLVYFPKADITFSGAVNKSSTGAACFVLVSYTVLVNGTANIFANNTGCASAGLTPPGESLGAGTREKLVQ